MFCPSGKAEVSAVYVRVNKLADNAAGRVKGGSLMCCPLHSIHIYAFLVHIP
jgi:hypothetical protein